MTIVSSIPAYQDLSVARVSPGVAVRVCENLRLRSGEPYAGGPGAAEQAKALGVKPRTVIALACGQPAEAMAGTITIASHSFGPYPYLAGIDHLVPADLPSAQRAAVEWYLERLIAGTGIGMGAFRCEIRLPGGVAAAAGRPGSGTTRNPAAAAAFAAPVGAANVPTAPPAI